MVVSIDDYAVLKVAILLLSIVYVVFLYVVGYTQPYSIVIRLICAFALVVIGALKMPMDISMDKSYADAVFMIIFWLVNATLTSIQLGYCCYCYL